MGKTVINISKPTYEDTGYVESGPVYEEVYDEVTEKTLICANPACGREFPHPAQRGRPPKWCGESCRLGAREESLRAREEARDSTPEEPFWVAYFEGLRDQIRV